MTQPRRRIPPAQLRGEVRRSRILDAAGEAFLLHGYAGAGMDALVAAVGGSKASIYRYFGSKAGLFMASVEHLCGRFLENLRAIDIAEGTREQRLEAILRELVAVVASPRHVAFYRMVVEGQAHVPGAGQAWFEHGPQVWYRMLREVIEGAGSDPARGGRPLPAIVPELLFDALFARLTTQTVMLGRTEGPLDQEAAIRALIAMVARHLMDQAAVDEGKVPCYCLGIDK